MLAAKSELMTVAHSAARAGTHEVDQASTLSEGSPVLAPQDARRAAVEHLHSSGARGQASVGDGRVVVLARITHTPTLLPISDREIEAEATATAHQP